MKLLVLLVVATIANANPLESSKPEPFQNFADCSKGMTYWCENVINAKRCGAVDFCISVVWESHKIAEDSNIICDDCKEWVGKARQFVDDKSPDVIKSLKWSCDQIPVKSLEKTCEKIVDENVPEILKMLDSAMEPNAVCTKLCFCHNPKLTKALSKNQLMPFTCSQCHQAGSVIEKSIQAMSHDTFLNKILQICGEMSSYSDSCSSIAIRYVDDIYKFISEKTRTNNLCQSAGACSAQQNQEMVVADSFPTADPGIPCQLCQQTVLHLRELLIANTSKLEFRNVLVGFCHQAGSFSNECINIAHEYSDTIYDFLDDKLNANKACVLMDICPRSVKDRVLKMPSMPLISSEIYPLPTPDSSIAVYKNGTWCSECEYFVRIIKEALAKQSTEDEIVNAMKRTCKEMPKKLQDECVALVELYGDAMMSLIDQGIKPENVCSKIKLCPPSLHMNSLEADEKPTCPFCLLALQDIRDIVASNMTKQNIAGVISRLCSHLSDKLIGQCTEFVKTYSDEVIEMLLADFTPQEACIFIKLCTENKTEYVHARIGGVDADSDEKKSDDSKMVANPQCELCKEVVKIVESRVINKKSKEEIRQELEKSCDRLKKFSAKCKQFVDKYSDEIVDLISQELEPQEVCHELMFCVSSNDEADSQDYDSGLEIFMMAENADVDEISEQPQCVMCEFVIKEIDDELNDNKTDERIKNVVRNICKRMPSSVGKSCKQFVDYYFDMIIVFIETVKPSEVCSSMKLCPAPKYPTLMVESIQHDIYQCAICKGLVEGLNSVFEDPYTETNFENMEEKLCEKFVGKYKPKCHDIVKNYGVAIVNLMKTLTESDQICYKLALCSWSDDSEVTGMLKLT